jgi:hypothetical protein
LAFAHSLGQELQKRGLHYTRHYTFSVMGRFRRELIDLGSRRLWLRSTDRTAHHANVGRLAGSWINREPE